jgi:hypothetical protein
MSGQLNPEKTIEYAKRALDGQLEATKRLQLFIYWGDALQVAHAGAEGQALMAARREAVVPYLMGLREAAGGGLPELPPPVPRGGLTGSLEPGTPEGESRLRADGAEALAAREKAKMQGRLIQQRDALRGQIAYMYSRLPFQTAELERLAARVIADQNEVDGLMARVKARIQKRLDDMGGTILEELPNDIESLGSTAGVQRAPSAEPGQVAGVPTVRREGPLGNGPDVITHPGSPGPGSSLGPWRLLVIGTSGVVLCAGIVLFLKMVRKDPRS